MGNKLTLNLSNQANMVDSKNISLSQFNFLVLLGLGYLDKKDENSNKVSVSINISQDGELEINGLNKKISDEAIRVYTDRKITHSDD